MSAGFKHRAASFACDLSWGCGVQEGPQHRDGAVGGKGQAHGCPVLMRGSQWELGSGLGQQERRVCEGVLAPQGTTPWHLLGPLSQRESCWDLCPRGNPFPRGNLTQSYMLEQVQMGATQVGSRTRFGEKGPRCPWVSRSGRGQAWECSLKGVGSGEGGVTGQGARHTWGIPMKGAGVIFTKSCPRRHPIGRRVIGRHHGLQWASG